MQTKSPCSKSLIPSPGSPSLQLLYEAQYRPKGPKVFLPPRVAGSWRIAVILVLSPCRWASVPARGKCLWIPPCLCLFASIVSAVIVSGDSFLWCVCMCVPVFQETALAEQQYAGSGATRCCFISVANHNASQPSACLPGTPAGLHPACWAALPLGENSHLQIKHNPQAWRCSEQGASPGAEPWGMPTPPRPDPTGSICP